MAERACRACGRPYEYPERKSAATRYHCASCAAVEPNARKALDLLRIEIRRLHRRLDAIEKGSAARDE
ncbi:MAG: hypothetical protein NTW86_31320 [Candidatus Sumerlaeota bacterium]|nr:hypothetical protein [Candidatus Sumerlaeota bacterium]